jgi:Zn-dependent protease
MSGPWDQPETAAAPAAPARQVSYALSLNAIILIGIWLAAGAGLQFAHWQPRLLTFVFVVAGWLLSVVAHEFCHALVAYRAGDWTVGPKGYLTGDPFRYTNLLTSIILPLMILALGGIGFPGGAVYLREDLMRNRWWRSAASLAGPLGTLAVFITLAAASRILMAFAPVTVGLISALAALVFLQATAFLLNMLPVPGLDGYGVIRPLLPLSVQRGLRRFEALGILVLFAAIMFVPGLSFALFGGASAMMEFVGVPFEMAERGISALRFWRG